MRQIFSKNASQEALKGEAGSETGKGKKPIEDELLSRLSLRETEAQIRHGTPVHRVKHTLELSTQGIRE